jgi:hypothetical protein
MDQKMGADVPQHPLNTPHNATPFVVMLASEHFYIECIILFYHSVVMERKVVKDVVENVL